MTSLYVLSHEYRTLAERLADLDLDATTIADTLEAEAGALEAKCTATAMVCRNIEATAAAIKEAEGEMKRRREAMERRADEQRCRRRVRLEGPDMTGTLNNCERCEHRAHRGDSGGWCDMFQLEPREVCLHHAVRYAGSLRELREASGRPC